MKNLSPTGWTAHFRTPEQTQKGQEGWTVPIDGWDESGRALIVDTRAARRIPVADLTHFKELWPADDPYSHALPGQGWQIAYSTAAPDLVVGWTYEVDGIGGPLITDCDGLLCPAEHVDGTAAWLVPPGCEPESSPYRRDAHEDEAAPEVRVFRRADGWRFSDPQVPEECTSNYHREQAGDPRCTDTAVWKVVEHADHGLSIGFYCDSDLPAEHRRSEPA